MENINLLQAIIHYSLHFLVPGMIAYIFFKNQWKKAWLIFVLTMLVDVDHLWSNPIFEAGRCSINFHFLHSYIAIAIYAVVFIFSKKNSLFKLISLGLLFHMLTDFIDCKMNLLHF